MTTLTATVSVISVQLMQTQSGDRVYRVYYQDAQTSVSFACDYLHFEDVKPTMTVEVAEVQND